MSTPTEFWKTCSAEKPFMYLVFMTMKRQNMEDGRGEKGTYIACFKLSVCRKPFYRKNMSPSNTEDVSPLQF